MSLLDYIKGRRKGTEAHRLEKEAMQDPFLADALEGFDKVEGDHIKAIQSLQKRVMGRTEQKKRIIWSWGVAASLLIGVLTGGYFFLKSDYIEDPMLAMESAVIIQDSSSEKAIVEEKELLARKEEIRETLTSPPQEPTVSIKELIIIEEKSVFEDSFELLDKIELIQAEDTSVFVEPYKHNLDNMSSLEEALQGKLSEVELSKRKNSERRIRGTSSFSSISSPNTVEGKVIDSDGEPLIGAMVHVRGTDRGAVTDIDGNFTLEILPDEILSVDYIGFESQNLQVDSQRHMLIAMNESNEILSEVIVMQGRPKKKDNVKIPKPLKGERAYKAYLKDNMRYPTEGACKNVKGKVKLSFYVDLAGRPYDIRVTENVCPAMDAEAIRLVEEGPDWTVEDGEVMLKIKF